MFCRPALLLQSYALSRCMTSFVSSMHIISHSYTTLFVTVFVNVMLDTIQTVYNVQCFICNHIGLCTVSYCLFLYAWFTI